MFRTCAAALMLLSVSLNAMPLSAATDREAPPEAAAAEQRVTTPGPASIVAASTAVVPPLAGDVDWSLPPIQLGASMPTRGGLLPFLYVGLGGLQAYDAYTTMTGVKKGATETNPVVGVIGNGPAFWVAKGGAALASVYMSEQLVKKHRRGQAIMLMVVTNSIMVGVAAANAHVLRAQR